MANGSSYNILQRIDCRSKGVDSRDPAPTRAMPRASILSVLPRSGHVSVPSSRRVHRLSFYPSFCIGLHGGGNRPFAASVGGYPRSDFFVRCPAQKEMQSLHVLLPYGDKAHSWPSRAARRELRRACEQRQMPMPTPTSMLALVENCIGSWLTERKCRGSGRSAGAGAALGSPACRDNCTRDALGRKPRWSRATDHRGRPRAIIYNFRRMRPPRLELTQ